MGIARNVQLGSAVEIVAEELPRQARVQQGKGRMGTDGVTADSVSS